MSACHSRALQFEEGKLLDFGCGKGECDKHVVSSRLVRVFVSVDNKVMCDQVELNSTKILVEHSHQWKVKSKQYRMHCYTSVCLP